MGVKEEGKGEDLCRNSGFTVNIQLGENRKEKRKRGSRGGRKGGKRKRNWIRQWKWNRSKNIVKIMLPLL